MFMSSFSQYRVHQNTRVVKMDKNGYVRNIAKTQRKKLKALSFFKFSWQTHMLFQFYFKFFVVISLKSSFFKWFYRYFEKFEDFFCRILQKCT